MSNLVIKVHETWFDILKRAEVRYREEMLPWVKGHCQSVEDGMDGFYIHAKNCTYYQQPWLGGSDCIDLEWGVPYQKGMK